LGLRQIARAVSRALVEMGAQLVDRGETHHAFRHLRLDRAVAGGGGGAGSVVAEGTRGGGRRGGGSGGRARSGLGQASSKLAG
jgi:hypothetical protein